MATDKTLVLITGANQGIGYLAAETLASSSPNYHIIIGSRSIERGQKALADLKAETTKSNISMVQLDVTDQNSIDSAVVQITKEFGRLDVLITTQAETPPESHC